MKDLEKELVEKLCECDAKNGYVCVLHREALPLIRSHTQALVAAAYARATNLIAQVRDDYHSNDGPFDMGMRLQMLENEVCSLTPADAARELERRELEKVIEGLKTARARTLPGCRTLVNLGHVPEAVRAGEWVQMDIEGEIADVEQRLASLSKPAPVSQTITPGICAKHAIVTPTCRNNRTPLGALAEAVERLQLEYIELLNHEGTDAVTYHFVLTVERKPAPVERSNENG